MSNFLHEAFQALKLTESETFELDKKGVADLSDFVSTDLQLEDTTVDIIDPEAETEEDLQKTYIGEVILECQACHVPHYCHPEDVVIDEESQMANIDDTCPNCYSNEGFKIVGTVAPYEDITVETTADNVEVKVDGKEVSVDETSDETLNNEDNLEESANAVDKDALRKRFAGRFATNESLVEKRGVKRHLTRKNKEEDIEACQKNPIDTEKSIAGELKEAKKRHLTRRNEEETLQKCQKGKVDVTKSLAGELKEAKLAGNNKPYGGAGAPKRTDMPQTKDATKNLVKSQGLTKMSESQKRELKKRHHISRNEDEESLQACQKGEVDVTKSQAGELKEERAARQLKRRHITRNEDEEALQKCQKGRLDLSKTKAGDPNESEILKGEAEASELKEAMEDISITTGDEVIKIKATPRADKETVVPPAELTATEDAPEEEAVAEMPDLENVESEDTAAADSEESVEIEEIDEASFDSLGESYLKRAYNNVKSFKTSKAMQSNNALVLEGKISFKSGKEVNTRFVFEAAAKDKKGNLQFLGLNENLAKKKGAFKLCASINDKKLVCESLNYNYHGKDVKTGKSQRLYGTVKNR